MTTTSNNTMRRRIGVALLTGAAATLIGVTACPTAAADGFGPPPKPHNDWRVHQNGLDTCTPFMITLGCKNPPPSSPPK